MDIRPPQKKPLPPPVEPVVMPPIPEPAKAPQSSKPGRYSVWQHRMRDWRWIMGAAVALIILMVTAGLVWYLAALQPLKPGSDEKIRVKVSTGETVGDIADNFKSAGVVRSPTAFRIYAELSGNKSKLKAGGYTISPGQSVPDIVNHLASGKTDELTVTIPPGVSTIGIREQLQKYGYTDQEISQALQAKYDSPLLADKPDDVGLDGYIFPETFIVDPNESVESLFKRSFDVLYQQLQQDGMIEKFKSHNLNIHQALTLASIVQKEVTNPTDQRQVAQVFYNRLAQDMVLGSDVTFIYAANQLGVEPSVNLDSPYNTRKYPGLPPGPIANMNYAAIQAIVDPAPGDYLYFVAGDREFTGETFYAKTEQEHHENIAKYCRDLCS
jgi:UPF0755 protein